VTISGDSYFSAEAFLLGFKPPEVPGELPSAESLAEHDRKSRYWTSTRVGNWQVGSETHKHELCRMFRETFNPYRPSIIDWPALSSEELNRLTSLPIWDIAVQTEGKARLSFAAYAGALPDREMAEAVMLNAWEENRHKDVLSNLVKTYKIPLAAEPVYERPRSLEWAYLVTGYSECVDSFFAFGLFEVARRSGFFPMKLVETFEPVIQEECRHILLFANWLAWHRANLNWWQRVRFEVYVAAVWIFIAGERIGLARGLGKEKSPANHDSNFTLNSAKAVSPVEIHFRDLMTLCLRENDRRFAGYDARLLRPTTIPRMMRFALALSNLWPGKLGRRQASSASS
jgi:hypothetical protein